MINEINLVELLNVIIRKWWIIAIMLLVCGGGSYIYTDLFVEPMYRTDGSIYVNCETEADRVDVASTGRIESSARLARSCIEVLQARSFLTEVARDLNNKYTYSQLRGMLHIESINDTEYLQITVEGHNPQDVCDIVDSILQRAGEHIVTIIKAGSVEVVDKPFVPSVPYSPNKSRNALLGAVAGAVVAIGFIFLMELFDTHIKNSDEMKKKYPEPVLGEIPSFILE